jgi:hypothetical protein
MPALLGKSFIALLLSLTAAWGTLIAGEPPGTPKSTSSEEYKAVRFSETEEAATKELNQLAAEGWRYVGPLGNGLTAFNRGGVPDPAASRLQGEWEYLSFEKDGEVVEYKAGQRLTLAISGNRWSVGPGLGDQNSHRVEISGHELVFRGLRPPLSPAGEKSPQATIAFGRFELKDDELAYVMTTAFVRTSFPPGMSPVKKPESLNSKGTENIVYRLRKKK